VPGLATSVLAAFQNTIRCAVLQFAELWSGDFRFSLILSCADFCKICGLV